MTAKKKIAKKKTAKKKIGRPLKYRPKYHPKMVYLAAKNGFTNTKIAEELDIAHGTLHDWREKYPEFSDALKKGKESADDEVVNALRRNALGCTVVEQKAFYNDGEIEIIELKKQLPPNPTSGIFWMKNRDPENWRDKVNHEVEGDIHINITIEGVEVDAD